MQQCSRYLDIAIVVLCQVLEQLKGPFFFVNCYATASTIPLLASMLFTLPL